MEFVNLAKDVLKTSEKNFLSQNNSSLKALNGEFSKSDLDLYLFNLYKLILRTQSNLKSAYLKSKELGMESLAEVFEEKIEEEKGHELWALEDLKNSKANDNELFLLNSMNDLIEYSTYLAKNDPLGYFAYTYFAEEITTSTAPKWINNLVKFCNINVDNMSVVTKHIELDKEHAKEGEENLENVYRHYSSLEKLELDLKMISSKLMAFFNELGR